MKDDFEDVFDEGDREPMPPDAPEAYYDDGDPEKDPPEVRAKVAASRTAQPAAEHGDAYEGEDKPAPKSRFAFSDSAEFLVADFRREYLITGVLAKGENGIIAGPSKTLKTSIAVDMAISLATGTPFLGAFNVPRPVRVAMVSGESGGATLQDTARRVLKAKGLDAEALSGRLAWSFTLPKFMKLEQVADFAAEVRSIGAEVVFLDPLYLCVGGDVDHANMFEMGESLASVAQMLQPEISTEIIHHANRKLQHGRTMELTDLAYSGLEQFARQWVLLNRQSEYQGNGVHPLLMSVGGSAGHGGRWDVTIREGVADEHFAGRFWEVTVDKPAMKEDAKEQRLREHETAVLLAIDAEASRGWPATVKAVRSRTGFDSVRARDTLERLVQDGVIETIDVKKSGVASVGYRRPDRPPTLVAV